MPPKQNHAVIEAGSLLPGGQNGQGDKRKEGLSTGGIRMG